ncbi:glutaredoxin family protein [Halomonas shantousis]
MFANSNSVKRSPEAQADVDKQCQSLALYQTNFCPFCIKVRREIERLKLPIELRDLGQQPQYRRELINGGGRGMVPCLQITHDDGHVEWMYESEDINRYLRRRFEPSR